MKIKLLLATLFVSIGTSQSQELSFELVNHDLYEERTKDQLLELMETHDLAPLLFTSKVRIQSGFDAIPKSHPVLTLNTRHLNDDELLLSTFIHEQLHWYVQEHPSKEDIYEELESMYPDVPHQFPQGSGGEVDTRYHILICHMEYQLLKHYIGELKAYQVFSFWKQDHYQWIYRTVLKDAQKIELLAKSHNIRIRFDSSK